MKSKVEELIDQIDELDADELYDFVIAFSKRFKYMLGNMIDWMIEKKPKENENY